MEQIAQYCVYEIETYSEERENGMDGIWVGILTYIDENKQTKP